VDEAGFIHDLLGRRERLTRLTYLIYFQSVMVLCRCGAGRGRGFVSSCEWRDKDTTECPRSGRWWSVL